ncbi:MAG: hypothetical protein HYV07_22235 [Deltaproteobacteria bacterium]|nr:hypothetical protein [Deltaproteobacteria bacterium]
MTKLSRRQVLLRGGLAAGGLAFSALVIRAASYLFESHATGLRILTSREVRILEAAIPALVPGGDGMPAGDAARLIPWIDSFLASAGSDTRILFRSMLHVVENEPLFAHGARFTSRSAGERHHDLRAFELATTHLEKKAFQSVKLVIGMAYFEQPAVLDSIGYFVGCAPPHLNQLSKDRPALAPGTSS